MIIDGGPVGIGVESTIIDMTAERPELLRPGFVTMEMLERLLDKVDRDPSLDRVRMPDDASPVPAPRAPGMKYRHYAPKGEMILVDGEHEAAAEYIGGRIRGEMEKGKQTAVICAEEDRERYAADIVLAYGKRSDYDSLARKLFRLLRTCDEEGADVIFAETVPGSGIGDALMNRLRKAAGYRIVNV